MTGSPQKDHQIHRYFIPNLHTPRFVVEELGKDDDQLAGAALMAVRGTTGWVGWKKTGGPLVMCDFCVVGWFGLTDVRGVFEKKCLQRALS